MKTHLSFASAMFLALISTSFAASTEQALTPEVNPPGDIPDTQVFVTYRAPEGFSLKVPEGWARRTTGGVTAFSDKYNIITIQQIADPGASVEQVTRDLVPRIASGSHVPKLGKVHTVKIKGKEAVLAEYTVNSEPNPVTGKQIRLEAERVFYPAGDKVIVLDLSAPQGADNVDQWKLIRSSVGGK